MEGKKICEMLIRYCPDTRLMQEALEEINAIRDQRDMLLDKLDMCRGRFMQIASGLTTDINKVEYETKRLAVETLKEL